VVKMMGVGLRVISGELEERNSDRSPVWEVSLDSLCTCRAHSEHVLAVGQ